MCHTRNDNTFAAKVETFKKQISTVEDKLTEKLKQEAEKAKTSIEEQLNTSFQMLEEYLKKKEIVTQQDK